MAKNKALERAQILADAWKAKNPELSEYNKKMQGIASGEDKTKLPTIASLSGPMKLKYIGIIKSMSPDKKKNKVGESDE